MNYSPLVSYNSTALYMIFDTTYGDQAPYIRWQGEDEREFERHLTALSRKVDFEAFRFNNMEMEQFVWDESQNRSVWRKLGPGVGL